MSTAKKEYLFRLTKPAIICLLDVALYMYEYLPLNSNNRRRLYMYEYLPLNSNNRRRLDFKA